MSWLLNAIYIAFLVLASPWLLWRRIAHGKSRLGWPQKLLGLAPIRKTTGKCVWLHAVSVGEVIMLETVIAELKTRDPELDIYVSTTTETAFSLAKRRFLNTTVFFCPFDLTWAIENTLKRIRPDAVGLVELEIWPNLIRRISKRGIPIGIINGRMSPKSFRGYSKFNRLSHIVFEMLDFVCVQNADYGERFVELGCDPAKVFVTGSIKFDGLETSRDNPKSNRLRSLAKLDSNHHVFLAGSTQPDESSMAVKVFEAFADSTPNLRLIIAPRHPETCDELCRELNAANLNYARRSELESPSSIDWRILVIDVIGELGAWWGCADVAFVGGSMGKRGGQNMLEPAAYGVPVSFGPNTDNFRVIVEALLACQGAEVVRDEQELKCFVEASIPEYNSLSEMGKRARAFVLSQSGACTRTVEVVESFVNPTKPGSNRRRNVA